MGNKHSSPASRSKRSRVLQRIYSRLNKLQCFFPVDKIAARDRRTNENAAMDGDLNDLPFDVLTLIAARLRLIELLHFRAVCKEWKSASSHVSAEIESSPNHKPWFLLYGDESKCVLVTETGKKYLTKIPEMDGATCLASNHGWLLLFHKGSMYFFCPFSRARISLPGKLVISKDHIAVFSSPPTSRDCVVCVFRKSSAQTTVELNVLQRGDDAWTKYEIQSPMERIRYAGYCDGVFYFFDNTYGMAEFQVKDRRLNIMSKIQVLVNQPTKKNCLPIRYVSDGNLGEMKRRLRLPEWPMFICGTTISNEGAADSMFPYEDIGYGFSECGCCHPKGVWFQPRFHQINAKQGW